MTRWSTCPEIPDHEVSWLEPPYPYQRATRQLAIRIHQPKGKVVQQVLILNLTDEALFELAQRPWPSSNLEMESAWAALAAYDRRGGGVETQNKSDKQGLALGHRNKRRFTAQEMLILLAQLAHNFVIWTRNDLAQAEPRFQHYGIQRTVRDVFQIPGCVQFDNQGKITAITLRDCHPLAPALHSALTLRHPSDEMSLNLGKI